MSSRDRVLTTLHHETPDRVPLDYTANGIIHNKLMQHFRLISDDYVGLLRALHVDFMYAGPRYIGPRRHPEKPGLNIDPEWGIHTRWVENEFGGYTDYCEFPLANLEPDTLANWPMPDPADYDYASIPQFCRDHDDFALFIGNAGCADIINQTGMLAGMEATLAGIATGDEALLNFIDRRLTIQLQVAERTLEAAGGRIDFFWMGEDLGTQRGPMVSMPFYQQYIQPRHRRFFELARSYALPVMVHSCGSSSWVYETFIEDGVAAVDTLQPEAANMSPQHLKSTYGGRLAFHGCISTAGPLAYGTAAEVRANVCETLDIMMPGGGYCLAPTHAIQDNSPLENVLEMYATGYSVGRY